MNKWETVGKQMVVNLENAREQYSVLGYPHRNLLMLRCVNCNKIVFVDSGISKYNFCPWCGDMKEGED